MKTLFNGKVLMKIVCKGALGALILLLSINSANAEDYLGLGLGWVIDAKLTGIKGNENLNYPDPTNANTSFPGTSYSSLDLKQVLQGGVRYGHFFENYPSIGIEIEGNYSQPNMKRQNVTISNPTPNASTGLGIGETIAFGGLPVVDANTFIESQLPAKVQILQFNLNAVYRYRELKQFIPYIGAGPSFNFVRISGTGYSGIFVDPATGTLVDSGSCPAGACSNVHDNSFNVGLNFKIGAEYKFDEDWGLGAEYRYNWVPINISNFRSASNLDADLKMQTISAVLTRHF